LERSPNAHLAFGRGIHYCLGAPLARLEMAVALSALLRESPALRLAGTPEWSAQSVIRSLRSLAVALG
jgi:cytochrome P450